VNSKRYTWECYDDDNKQKSTTAASTLVFMVIKKYSFFGQQKQKYVDDFGKMHIHEESKQKNQKKALGCEKNVI